MSLEEDDLESVDGGPTWEELGHNLFKGKLLAFITEIVKPDAFTGMDDYADFCAANISPKVGCQIVNHQNNYRINMVSYKRKRSLEGVEMVKGNVEKERQKKDLQEIMTGMNK